MSEQVPPPEPLGYQTPSLGPDPGAALTVPAIGLLLFGILTLCCIGLDFLSRLLRTSLTFHYGVTINGNDLGPLLNVISVPLLIAMIFGATCMLRRKEHGFAVGGAILAMIPLTATCCCIVTLPLGIWAMVLLNRPEVKARFR